MKVNYHPCLNINLSLFKSQGKKLATLITERSLSRRLSQSERHPQTLIDSTNRQDTDRPDLSHEPPLRKLTYACPSPLFIRCSVPCMVHGPLCTWTTCVPGHPGKTSFKLRMTEHPLPSLTLPVSCQLVTGQK